MSIDPNKVLEEVRKGLSIVCSTCRHYWRAKDVGLANCGKDCTGPISGGYFPEYDGELPDLLRFCFVCGTDSYYALQIGQSPRRVGVCRAHLTHLNELVPKSGIVQAGQLFASRNGEMIRVDRIFRRPKTVAAAMAEQEQAWKEEDKYNAEKLGIDPDKLVEN